MTGLVGRAVELAQLVAGLDDAADGRGLAVLVSSEAGIGKTRLIVELTRLALDRGTTVLDGRCIDLIGQGVPYFALIDALRGAPDALASVDLGSLVGPFAAGRPDADGQLRLFDDVTQVLVGLTNAAPVILVLEDLHWADGSTLDFVSYLSRTIRNHRILLVGTF